MRDALTPAEARERWCPFGRVHISAELPGVAVALAAVNMGKTESEGTPCRAAYCMAWRWAGWETKSSGWLVPNPEPEDRVGKRRGFCGLAGMPL